MNIYLERSNADRNVDIGDIQKISINKKQLEKILKKSFNKSDFGSIEKILSHFKYDHEDNLDVSQFKTLFDVETGR